MDNGIPAVRPRVGPAAGRVPQLTVSARVFAVLEPVHWLLRRVNAYVQRRVAREVGRQLREGTPDGQLRQRLAVRFSRTSPREIRDPGRWLLGVALPRWGCGNRDCEAGVLWSSGVRCAICAEVAADRRSVSGRPGDRGGSAGTGPPGMPVAALPPRGECLGCGRPGARGSGQQRACPGWNGIPCGRRAPHSGGLCVRCRCDCLAGPPGGVRAGARL